MRLCEFQSSKTSALENMLVTVSFVLRLFLVGTTDTFTGGTRGIISHLLFTIFIRFALIFIHSIHKDLVDVKKQSL
jgi:hypothetical protein